MLKHGDKNGHWEGKPCAVERETVGNDMFRDQIECPKSGAEKSRNSTGIHRRFKLCGCTVLQRHDYRAMDASEVVGVGL